LLFHLTGPFVWSFFALDVGDTQRDAKKFQAKAKKIPKGA